MGSFLRSFYIQSLFCVVIWLRKARALGAFDAFPSFSLRIFLFFGLKRFQNSSKPWSTSSKTPRCRLAAPGDEVLMSEG